MANDEILEEIDYLLTIVQTLDLTLSLSEQSAVVAREQTQSAPARLADLLMYLPVVYKNGRVSLTIDSYHFNLDYFFVLMQT